ncbi:MAG: hypothetical protein QXG32_02940 [Candidatus Bathyarchaeia archaeon]
MADRGACSICGRAKAAGSDLCELHLRAELSLKAAYEDWSKAYGGKLQYREFLEKLLGLSETGWAVKELIRRKMGST